MQRNMRFFVLLMGLCVLTVAIQGQAVPANAAITTAPRNIILFIGDGMGPEQVRAAGLYQHGNSGTLFMESLPYSTTMSTYSANSGVTDSAAAATAMATGSKVNNGVISQAIPGDGSDLETLAELFHQHCKSVGLVTTAYATHATPAAFGAHEPSRYNLGQIANDYFTQTKPDVLFGGGSNGMNPTLATNAGYLVITNRTEMLGLDPTVDRVSGQFGNTHLPYEYDYSVGLSNGYDALPHLSEMVTSALQLLEQDTNGFFLMVEGARIDHAGHANNLEQNIFETLAFDQAIEVAHNWAISRTDTLIVVTADHETGDLTVTGNNGVGNFPSVTWGSTGHTGINVPVYAWGANAASVLDVEDNTDIYTLASAGLGTIILCTPNAVIWSDFRAQTGNGFALIFLLLGAAIVAYSKLTIA